MNTRAILWKLTVLIIGLALIVSALPALPAHAAPAVPNVAASAPEVTAADLLQFQSGGHALGFAPDGLYAASATHAYRVQFVGAAPTLPVADEAAAAGEADAGRAAPLSRVTYADLWRGITLTYDAPEGAILRSTYRLEAGADPNSIRLAYNVPATLNADGSLSLPYDAGQMTESAPVAWQEMDGKHVPVDVAFALLPSPGRRGAGGEVEVGFTLGDYDPASPLFIDPTLVWNTFLGGGGVDDMGFGITFDASGNVYVAGDSNATWGSPARAFTPGTATTYEQTDAFVAKLDSSGALLWNTFLGGNADDGSYAVVVDASNVYVLMTSTGDWGSPLRAYSGGSNDLAVAKLDSANGALIWHTFLGGSGNERTDVDPHGLDLDGSGNLLVTGRSSEDWGAGDCTGCPLHSRAPDVGGVFAAKLDSASGALTWNTFLPSVGSDGFISTAEIATDASGDVYISGEGWNAWDPSVTPVNAHSGGSQRDTYVAKLSAAGALQWHTFMGSSSTEEYDAHLDIVGGAVYVAGRGNGT